jgi:hypothetical protein
MKKIIVLSTAILLVLCNNPVINEKKDSPYLGNEIPCSIFSTLSVGKISYIQVEYFRTLYSTEPGKKIIISNTDTIDTVVNLLKMLPDSGQIFVSWGQDAPMNKVVLVGSNMISDTVIIIENRVKTPATTFYSPEKPEEKQFVNFVIDSLIQTGL